jgi:hypothetical protein
MNYRKLVTAALTAVLALPFVASAQALKPGKWTGTAKTPDGVEVALTFDVKVAGDTTTVMLNAGEHGTYKLEEVKVVSDKLTFWFVPGPRVNCALAKKPDGSFAGSCLDEGGGDVPMTMIPPRTEGDS